MVIYLWIYFIVFIIMLDFFFPKFDYIYLEFYLNILVKFL